MLLAASQADGDCRAPCAAAISAVVARPRRTSTPHVHRHVGGPRHPRRPCRAVPVSTRNDSRPTDALSQFSARHHCRVGCWRRVGCAPTLLSGSERQRRSLFYASVFSVSLGRWFFLTAGSRPVTERRGAQLRAELSSEGNGRTDRGAAVCLSSGPELSPTNRSSAALHPAQLSQRNPRHLSSPALLRAQLAVSQVRRRAGSVESRKVPSHVYSAAVTGIVDV